MKTCLELALVLTAVPGAAGAAQVPTQESAPAAPLPSAQPEQTLLEMLRAKGLLTSEEYEVLARRLPQAPKGASAEERLDEALARIEQRDRAMAGGRETPAVTVTHVPGAGFTFETEDRRLSTTVGGWVQFRSQYSNNGGGGVDEWNFEIEHARLSLSGHAFEPWFQYVFEVDLVGQSATTDVQTPTDAEGDVTSVDATHRQVTSLKDGYFDIVPVAEFGTRAGQFKVPYSRQELISDARQELPDRSITSDFFSLGREVGLDLHGAVESRLFYDLGVYNGTSENQVIDTNGTKLLYDARLGVMVLGDDASDAAYLFEQSGDTRRVDKPLLGLESAHVQDDAGAEDRSQVELSGLYKGYGLAFEGAYLARHIDPSTGTSTSDDGYYAQVGYMVTAHIEGVYRNAYLHVDGSGKQSENTLGANYYFYGHSLKLQVSYRRLGSAPDQGSREVQDLWIVQLQAAF